nr:unnamed protein product [Callosobruchus chinensis]
MRNSSDQMRVEVITSLEQTVANIQGTVVDLGKELKRHQDVAVGDLRGGLEPVMTRLEEQRQAVRQALENQDQRISAIEIRIEISQKVGEQLATSQKHVEELQLQQVKDLAKEMRGHSEAAST